MYLIKKQYNFYHALTIFTTGYLVGKENFLKLNYLSKSVALPFYAQH